jgi:hypothetical protein
VLSDLGVFAVHVVDPVGKSQRNPTIGYGGPISIEWEDAGIDRLEARSDPRLVRGRNAITPSTSSFGAAFASTRPAVAAVLNDGSPLVTLEATSSHSDVGLSQSSSSPPGQPVNKAMGAQRARTKGRLESRVPSRVLRK